MQNIKIAIVKRLITLILVITANACINPQENNNNISKPGTNYTDRSGTTDSDDFQLFWNIFRQAIIDNDTVKLVEMTNFPLKSHGNLDEDPQPSIPKNKFYYFLQKCLNEHTGPGNETNLDYIKKTINLVNDRFYTSRDGWCRVSSFVFETIGHNWKLSLIYFDTNEKNN